jgi:hypothetical protein
MVTGLNSNVVVCQPYIDHGYIVDDDHGVTPSFPSSRQEGEAYYGLKVYAHMLYVIPHSFGV